MAVLPCPGSRACNAPSPKAKPSVRSWVCIENKRLAFFENIVVGHLRVGSITEQVYPGFIQWSWIDGGSHAHLASLVDLESLKVSQTRITDVGLQHLDSMTKLRELDLNAARPTYETTYSQISVRGISKLSSLGQLEVLKLRQSFYHRCSDR